MRMYQRRYKLQGYHGYFTIDRTQWGVNYGSKTSFKDLKDSFINDDMEVTITIVANAE